MDAAGALEEPRAATGERDSSRCLYSPSRAARSEAEAGSRAMARMVGRSGCASRAAARAGSPIDATSPSCCCGSREIVIDRKNIFVNTRASRDLVINRPMAVPTSSWGASGVDPGVSAGHQGLAFRVAFQPEPGAAGWMQTQRPVPRPQALHHAVLGGRDDGQAGRR